MIFNVVAALLLSFLALYVVIGLPGGYMWSKRRVHDHERVVRMLAGVLGVAQTPEAVLTILRMLVKEIELESDREKDHPFFRLPAVAALNSHGAECRWCYDPAVRFRKNITHFAEQALTKRRGPFLFSYREVTPPIHLMFCRRWEQKEPYDDFEERRLVKYLRSKPRIVYWPRLVNI